VADHGHDHDHDDRSGRLRGLLSHRHEAASSVDSALEASEEGVRALALSLLGLGTTAAIQLVVALWSGSVALLNDTIHNGADALTALPLWLAFSLGRRPATPRYPYGYGRSEDLAGLVVVVMIAGSAAIAAYEAFHGLIDPREVRHLPAVAAASVVGFAGNEAVARYRIRVGRRIGSAALVADGLHARTDGLSSLGVLAGVAGVVAGFERADAVAGMVIAVMILLVLRQAIADVGARLMDAVDPALADQAREVLAGVEGVERVGALRVRWIGHRLHAEADVVVDQDLSVAEAHRIAEAARHGLLHDVPRLVSAIVHADPCDHDGTDHHADVKHHDLGDTPHPADSGDTPHPADSRDTPHPADSRDTPHPADSRDTPHPADSRDTPHPGGGDR
jgi:cation diffusion facilitator family transporter